METGDEEQTDTGNYRPVGYHGCDGSPFSVPGEYLMKKWDDIQVLVLSTMCPLYLGWM